jgi:glycosyltransferase involved in cell wall biosynthesis
LLRGNHFSLKKTALIVSGLRDLPPERRTPALAAREAGRPLRVLFAGRMDQQKGVDLLLREFAAIDPCRATLTLAGAAVVGSADLAVPPHVERLGWVARDALPTVLADYDAVIMPSRWEGMPLWAIEVMRSGRALVCSSHGAFPHFIEDGVNGLLVDIGRPDFVREALSRLEMADLPAMGRAARRTYEAQFTSERMNAELMALYQGLAGRSRAVTRSGAIGAAIPRPSHPKR